VVSGDDVQVWAVGVAIGLGWLGFRLTLALDVPLDVALEVLDVWDIGF
jgi:hypothetical protein